MNTHRCKVGLTPAGRHAAWRGKRWPRATRPPRRAGTPGQPTAGDAERKAIRRGAGKVTDGLRATVPTCASAVGTRDSVDRASAATAFTGATSFLPTPGGALRTRKRYCPDRRKKKVGQAKDPHPFSDVRFLRLGKVGREEVWEGKGGEDYAPSRPAWFCRGPSRGWERIPSCARYCRYCLP